MGGLSQYHMFASLADKLLHTCREFHKCELLSAATLGLNFGWRVNLDNSFRRLTFNGLHKTHVLRLYLEAAELILIEIFLPLSYRYLCVR